MAGTDTLQVLEEVEEECPQWLSDDLGELLLYLVEHPDEIPQVEGEDLGYNVSDELPA